MPLSEEELRLLEQMERALVEEDPKFASALRGTPIARRTKGKLVISVLAFLAGIAVLMTGAMTRLTWVGIIGFVVMLVAATIGLSTWSNRNHVAEKTEETPGSWVPDHPSGFSVVQGGKKDRKRGRTKSPRGPKTSGSFMQRMDQRWQRRRDDRGGM